MLAVGISVALWIGESWAAPTLRMRTFAHVLETPFPWLVAGYAVLGCLALLYVDVYRDRRLVPFRREAVRIAKALAAANLVVAPASWALWGGPGTVLLMGALSFALSFGLVLLARALGGGVRRGLRARGRDVRTALLVDAGEPAQRVAEALSAPRFGYRIAGVVKDMESGKSRTPEKALGGLDRLEDAIVQHNADEAILCVPDWPVARVVDLLAQLHPLHVRVRLVNAAFARMLARARVPLDRVDAIPMLDLDFGPMPAWRAAARRAADVALAGAALVLTSPVLALAAAAVWTETGRPILFRQERVNGDLRTFRMYKIRSMLPAESPARERNRVTRVGRLLRKYSLDELPQVYNVLRGDMSLVGPRPPLPEEVRAYLPWQRMRLTDRPGLTGLWQVSGRNRLDLAETVICDLYHLWHPSWSLDLRILVRTVPAVLLGRGE